MVSPCVRLFVAVSGLALCARARVGESLSQSVVRYGQGREVKEDAGSILGKAQNVVYRHGDWIITAAYVNDATVRIQYEKVAGQQPRMNLQKEDVLEILAAEDAGGWSAFNEMTQKTGKAYTGEGYPPAVMRSASGLMARYRVFNVVVESPAAALHESGRPKEPVIRREQARSRVSL